MFKLEREPQNQTYGWAKKNITIGTLIRVVHEYDRHQFDAVVLTKRASYAWVTLELGSTPFGEKVELDISSTEVELRYGDKKATYTAVYILIPNKHGGVPGYLTA